MKVRISPSIVSGEITVAASKSAMQRACALALLHNGVTIIENPGVSNDDKAALSIIEALGATVNNRANGTAEISSTFLNNLKTEYTINCGESGLSIRMFAPIAALLPKQVSITGSGSLVTRPMNFFDEVFPKLNVEVQSNNGKLPLLIKGPLEPKPIEIDGSLSSQFLTGMLFSYAKAAREKVSINAIDLKSTPYIDLSLQMLQEFGYTVTNENYHQFTIEPGNTKLGKEIFCNVEGDWSGAAFLLVTGAIAGKILVKGLNPFSAQADKAILAALSMCGANISINSEAIEIAPGTLKAFQFNATHCPDLFPPLVALAAYCDGTTVIEGALRLLHKESNRALTLQEEFGKMGVEIKLQDDLMIIEGNGKLNAANVHSHHDHRIAMALAVAALKATGDTLIDNADAINKSYPAFYEHLSKLGAKLNVF
ncbi:MAG TPA: 3-phosphoshikimate 1-carboxyvinyltransferase [Ferruginibacter sp.]|nr:3-phosphoshikimate 1-carboxyvinyltransferase [Ferruginibacter sp.]